MEKSVTAKNEQKATEKRWNSHEQNVIPFFSAHSESALIETRELADTVTVIIAEIIMQIYASETK